MSRQEAAEQYAIALKAGQKCRKECLIQGKYPYPQVLDEIFDESMAAGRVELGTINIPTEHIVGTKTGRTPLRQTSCRCSARRRNLRISG